MWKAKIIRTDNIGGKLRIVVSYFNDSSSFDENINTEVAQADGWLEEQLTIKLNKLNGLSMYAESINASLLKSKISEIDANGALVESNIK